jgi:LmbE family N-acetylglucosaminyl deacetylase
MCGDSTVATDVAALLSDVEPHLMVTDPPNGVEYDTDWRNHALCSNGSTIGGRAIGKVQNDDNADWSEAWRYLKATWPTSGTLETRPNLLSIV